MKATGFVAVKSTRIPSLNVGLDEYRHQPTGARHFHIAADDTNNAFLVAFLTVPQDSTGIAHILEHTSLCGSRRFPVRDPFFMMIRRSLNTFMNAFTASDWTAYPFASQNRKDFYNLLEVYLDAVFFPLLDPLDFAQEGHRVELADPDDPDSPLEYRGVVYNEMKGAMSSPQSQVAQALQSRLFPTITYHHNSGGDPGEIPKLTHTALTDFHARHYHPSNALFMTYGSFPAADHHERIEALALSKFSGATRPTPMSPLVIPDEQRYREPKSAVDYYTNDEADGDGRRSHVVMGWLLGNTTDLVEVMRARVLAGVLLDNSASPLRHALETTSLGAAPSELCGLDDSTREATFACGLEGCREADAPAIESLVLETLERLARDGVDRSTVEATLHQVELAQREVGGGGFPYGLQLMVRALGPALYGVDPGQALDVDPVLAELRESIHSPDFIPGLVRRLLLENPHRVRLTMVPDAGLSQERAETERATLEALRRSLDARGLESVKAQTTALKARQEAPDDAEQLPKVGIEDVPRDLDIPSGRRDDVGGYPVSFYTPSTNGLVYVQVIAPLPDLSSEELDRLPLLADLFTDVGCNGRDYLETQAWQAEVTGGIRARTSVRSCADDVGKLNGYFVLAAKALARNQGPMLELIRETFAAPRFDEHPRLKELVAQARLHAEAQITDHGHSLALLAASAGMSPCGALEHRWGGLFGIGHLKSLDDAFEDESKVASFAVGLAELHRKIIAEPGQLLVVSDPGGQESLRAELTQHWAGLPSGPASGAGGLEQFVAGFEPSRAEIAWTTNTQVNFCARAFPTVAQGHPDAAALRVLGPYLRNGWLHRAIREQGGAYGAGAGYSADAGSFRFYSYRDPRLGDTLEDFDRAVAWLMDADHESRLLEEAILGVISEIDRPDSPAGEAITAFFGDLHGRTAERRRAHRRAVLDVTLDDLRRVAEDYLRPTAASTALVTSSAELDAEQARNERVARLRRASI